MADLGSDIAGVFDLDATLSTVSGKVALAQAILRRLSTARGSLLGAPSYGFDLHAMIGSTLPLSLIEQRVREQAVAEEEVDNARVDATFNPRTGALRVELRVVASEGPFDLTLEATELTIDAFLDGVLFAQAA